MNIVEKVRKFILGGCQAPMISLLLKRLQGDSRVNTFYKGGYKQMMKSNTVISRISALYDFNAIFAPNFKDMIIEEDCNLDRVLTV